MQNQIEDVGIVLIGRNEGERLIACLHSLGSLASRSVYVDSGSTDSSVGEAHKRGVSVVELPRDQPFTAARARNAGLAVLAGAEAPPAYVQFVDGDCILEQGWITAARAFLVNHPNVAIVCGRRRERFPEASVYNRLCDWEWNTPVGQTLASGGDALIRMAALKTVGGYSDNVIAAEDDELSVRLRKAGWQIWRLDTDMTWHDAAITRFGQWWRRAVRAGHGFAQVGALHPDYFVAPRRRAWLWGAILPVVAVAGVFVLPLISLGVAGLYGLSFLRSASRFSKGGMSCSDALRCAGLFTVSKVCNVQGALTYWLRRWRSRTETIIEYK